VENSERDGNIRPPDLPLEKFVCRSGSNKASGSDGIPVERFQTLENCAALNMPANLENSAVATELEKVSFHSNPKEMQCQRMLKLPHNCTHLTHISYIKK